MQKNTVREIIPEPIKSMLRPIIHFGRDAAESIEDSLDLLLGRRDKLTPPRKYRAHVGNIQDALGYRAVGEEFLGYFKAIGNLRPDEDVLDVGCGCGQMAAQLTDYLHKDAKYEGFDAYSPMIEWCEKNITSRYPNFHFQIANLFNKRYNPEGEYKASEYEFPFKDETFDFLWLKSIFTHMLPQDMENYFSEIARVLRKGGRCLITYFLLNDESSSLISDGKSAWDFKYKFGTYLTVDPDMPEELICYNEAYILNLYEKYGLQIQPPIHYGDWCGRPNSLSHQDIVVASKR